MAKIDRLARITRVCLSLAGGFTFCAAFNVLGMAFFADRGPPTGAWLLVYVPIAAAGFWFSWKFQGEA